MFPAFFRIGQKGGLFTGRKVSLLAIITYFDYRKNDSISKFKGDFYDRPACPNILLFKP
jgi:hypothetical protein